jgi:hypothetical protein
VTRHLDLQLGLSSSDRISATGWNVPRYDHHRAGSANVCGLCGSDANTVIGAAAALLLAIGLVMTCRIRTGRLNH